MKRKNIPLQGWLIYVACDVPPMANLTHIITHKSAVIFEQILKATKVNIQHLCGCQIQFELLL
jgi:hypothetical protein